MRRARHDKGAAPPQGFQKAAGHEAVHGLLHRRIPGVELALDLGLRRNALTGMPLAARDAAREFRHDALTFDRRPPPLARPARIEAYP